MSAQPPYPRRTARRNRYSLAWSRPNRAALIVLCAVGGAVVCMQSMAAPVKFEKSPPVFPHRRRLAFEGIDPNTASIASLRRLGGIGPRKASAIVEYRRSVGGRAFSRPRDLQKVHGIGPATVKRAEPYLVFPDNPGL